MKFVKALGRLLKKLFARKLVRVVAIIVIIIVPAIVWLSMWSSGPAETTIHIDQPQPTSASTKPAYQPLKTTYFTTEVPSSWRIQTPTTQNDRLQVLAFSPSGVSGAGGQAGISSALMPANGFRDIGDYNLRFTDSADYTHITNDSALPAGTEEFKSTTTTPGYTVFITHDGRYAEISLTGFETLDAAHSSLLYIVTHWQWL